MATEKRGRRPERPPFWIAFGFISAFAATILTVVLTGLYVRAPGSQSNAGSGSNRVGVTAQPAQAAPAPTAAESVPRPGRAAVQPASREEAEVETSPANGDSRADAPQLGPAEPQ